MNKQTSFLSLLFFTTTLFSGFDFADQESVVQIKSGARMYVDSAGQTISGTLKHDSGSTIDGQPLTFSNGIVDRDGKTATLTGTYDADAGPTFLLQGSGRLEAGRNFTVNTVTVSGESNALAGTPVLSNPVALPTDTDLICDITAPLNNLITIDGGTVTLNADLVCANDMALNGTGTIALNGFRYALAGYYESALDSTLTFNNALNFELQGKLPLSGDWTFTGTNVLDGKGATFDLRLGGTITIGSGSRLVLRDVLLKGVSQTNLIFTDATSVLELDRSQLDLTTSMTTDEGKIEVTGDSTFVMKDKDWTIKDNGKLTVDASILSLNVLGTDDDAQPGTVKAPLAVYKERVKQTAAISSNITNGTLALNNSGVIAEVGERLDEELLGGGVEGQLVLDKSTLMSPDDVIRISANATIDGKGSRILFARPGNAQLIIDPGVELTLENVELHGLIDSTMFLGVGAKLNIGPGVIFSLADDVTWDNEEIKVVGDNTVFELRSIGGPRTFQLKSEPIAGSAPGLETYAKHLDLTTNSISLHNVFFKGLDHIASTTATVGGVSKTGSIILSGDARVDFSAARSSVTPETFVVHGLNNRLRLRSDNLTVQGGIRFDGTTTSALHLEFVLPATFHGTPQLNIDAGGIDVSAASGHAYLISDTHSVRIKNNAANSFTMGDNGFLVGNKIEILGHPIQQTSSKVVLSPGLELVSSLTGGAIVPSTELLDAMRLPEWLQPTRALSTFELQQQERIQGMLTRALELPNENIKPVLHYDSAVALSELAGNIMLRSQQGMRYTNWAISASRDVNMTMHDGVEVIQATSSTTTIKETDVVNVVGGSTKYPNTLDVKNDLTINGKLLLGDNAVLQVRAEPDGTPPTVAFGSASSLSFGANSTLIFSGRGTLALPASFMIDFAQTKSTLIIEDGMQLLLSDGEQVTVGGKGTVLVGKGGQIIVEDESALRFGASYTDDLTLRANTGGSVRVGNVYAGDAEAVSYLSFVMTKGVLDFSHGGTMTLGVGGRLESNLLKAVSLPGEIEKVDFSNGGSLYVAAGAEWSLMDNLPTRSGMDVTFHGGQIAGTGTIQAKGTSLSGAVQNNIFSQSGQTAAQVVGNLIQQMPTLPHAVVFDAGNGVTKVKTKNGVIVTLGKNEVVLSEDDDGKVTGFRKFTNRYFYLDADGNRLGATL